MQVPLDLNVKVCPDCSKECPPQAVKCVCGHAFSEDSTRIMPGIRCAKCAAPLSPGFVMCPMCGQYVYPLKVAVPIIFAMWGFTFATICFFFVCQRTTSVDGHRLLFSMSEIAYVASLVLAIILACHRHIVDRVNGWLAIGLVSLAFIIVTIDPMVLVSVPESPKTQAAAPYQNGYRQNGQGLYREGN